MTAHHPAVVTAVPAKHRREGEPSSATRADVFGWLSVAALTLVVAAGWAPMLDAAFGDNHEGRIMARFALHMRNLHEYGVAGSHFSAGWLPHQSQPYAHHPPLLNILDAVSAALPGEGEYQVRLAPYALGLLAIPAAAALLRAFRLAWVPVLTSVGLMVVTGFYWFYGRFLYDLATVLAMSAAIAHLRRRAHPRAGLVAVACAASVLAVLGTWLGIVAAVVLGTWLLRHRGLDRPTVAVLVSMVAGVTISLAFVVGVSGLSVLLAQGDYRTSGGDFTMAEFFARQWLWLRRLLPVWYLVLLPAAVFVGLVDRRTRFYVAFGTMLTIGWVVALPNGSYMHDYWPFVVLIPGVVGMGVLLDRVWQCLPRTGARLAAAGVVGLLAVAFGHLVTGPTGAQQLSRPIRAGELVRDHAPAPGQRIAYHVGVGSPRWLAYYWDLHDVAATRRVIASARPDDLVVVRLDRIPRWADRGAARHVVARNGGYGLIRAGDLRR